MNIAGLYPNWGFNFPTFSFHFSGTLWLLDCTFSAAHKIGGRTRYPAAFLIENDKISLGNGVSRMGISQKGEWFETVGFPGVQVYQSRVYGSETVSVDPGWPDSSFSMVGAVVRTEDVQKNFSIRTTTAAKLTLTYHVDRYAIATPVAISLFWGVGEIGAVGTTAVQAIEQFVSNISTSPMW